jgi:hypothetical protein
VFALPPGFSPILPKPAEVAAVDVLSPEVVAVDILSPGAEEETSDRFVTALAHLKGLSAALHRVPSHGHLKVAWPVLLKVRTHALHRSN